jgi:hypothetical protein
MVARHAGGARMCLRCHSGGTDRARRHLRPRKPAASSCVRFHHKFPNRHELELPGKLFREKKLLMVTRAGTETAGNTSRHTPLRPACRVYRITTYILDQTGSEIASCWARPPPAGEPHCEVAAATAIGSVHRAQPVSWSERSSCPSEFLLSFISKAAEKFNNTPRSRGLRGEQSGNHAPPIAAGGRSTAS